MSSPDFVVERVSGSADAVHLRASVPLDLRYFEGHFEGKPMLPGIAQLIGLVHQRARESFGELGREKRIVRVKFEAVIVPGDVVDVHLERAPKDDETHVRFEIRRAETRCASGTIVYGAP